MFVLGLHRVSVDGQVFSVAHLHQFWSTSDHQDIAKRTKAQRKKKLVGQLESEVDIYSGLVAASSLMKLDLTNQL